MANNGTRFYLSKEQRDKVVQSLDDARFCVINQLEVNTGHIPTGICAAINKLLGATQWVIHQEPFLSAHQEQWKQRSEDTIPF